MMIDPKLPAIHHFLLSIGFEVRNVLNLEAFNGWKTIHYRFRQSNWTLTWTLNGEGLETWNAPFIPNGAPYIDDDRLCFRLASDAIGLKNRHKGYTFPVWRTELSARIRAVECPPNGQSSIL